MDIAQRIKAAFPHLPLPKLSPEDVLWKDLLKRHKDFPILGKSRSEVFQVGDKAFKVCSTNREAEMASLAGDCAIKIVGHAIALDLPHGPYVKGLLMEIADPLDIKNIPDSEKPSITTELLELLTKLHSEYKMVHGDIKPANILRCKDEKLRFCDFEAARPIDEPVHMADGNGTARYLGPALFDHPRPGNAALEIDDLYAMAVTLWEIHTGELPYGDKVPEDYFHRRRKTLDIMKVQDIKTREWIKNIFDIGAELGEKIYEKSTLIRPTDYPSDSD